MRYTSLFSGLGSDAIAFEPLGWECMAFAEIEPFQSAVLRERYPDVPNLGDVTKVDWSKYKGKVDLVIGGPPCQGFSTAGLRGGMADLRGNLVLEFIRAISEVRPEWVIFENVPGLIQDKTGALEGLLSSMNGLDYSVECDILDSIHFGVPQRRRRLFLVCHSVRAGRKKKTPLFVSTTAKMLTELLLACLAAACEPSTIGASNLVWPKGLSADGLRTKIELFGLLRNTLQGRTIDSSAFQSLLRDWEDALAKCVKGPTSSGYTSRKSSGMSPSPRGDTQYRDAGIENGSWSTPESWKKVLGVVSLLLNGSTTSTKISPITDSTIYTCARITLSIAESMLRLRALYPNSCDADSCGLTALRGFIRYARQKDREFFGQESGICDWNSFVKSAEMVESELELGLGEGGCPEQILYKPQGNGGIPKNRAADRTEVASPASSRLHQGSWNIKPSQRLEPGFYIYDRFNNTVSPVAPAIGTNCGLQTGRTVGIKVDSDGTIVARRLTPNEIERLQGFPTNWTLVPWRGRMSSDRQRYMSLGNAFPPPMIRCIGERIQNVENENRRKNA